MYIVRVRAYVYICEYLCVCARVRIRPYTRVYVRIRAHASVYVRARRGRERFELAWLSTSWPSGAETLIITTKFVRMTLAYCILQCLERQHTGTRLFLFSYFVGPGPGGEPFKEGYCTLNTEH